jgi:hypothetical protein
MNTVKCCDCNQVITDALGYPIGGDPDNVVGPFCWTCYCKRYERQKIKNKEPNKGDEV